MGTLMKIIKKLFSIGLALAVASTFSGCKKETSMANYNLSEYITLPEYKGLEVDTKDVEYQFGIANAHYENFSSAITEEPETLNEGTVQALDTVNIDYVGKKDGVAFEGGTAEGYDLMIGSSSFIEGFEAGLVGKKVGETVNLDLTFPEGYQSEELAGKAVVFTVKINSISRPKVPAIDQKSAEEMGFKTLEDYEASLKENYLNNELFSRVVTNTKVIMYPEEELNKYIEDNMDSVKEQAEESGTTLANFLAQNGLDEETYRGYLGDYAKSFVMQKMVFYAIAKNEKLTVTEQEVDGFIAENYNSADISDDDRNWVMESLLQKKVCEFLVQNAKLS